MSQTFILQFETMDFPSFVERLKNWLVMNKWL